MSDASKEFLLSELRAASARAKMWEAQLNSIGFALKNDLVTVEGALQMLRDVGGMGWICQAMETLK